MGLAMTEISKLDYRLIFRHTKLHRIYELVYSTDPQAETAASDPSYAVKRQSVACGDFGFWSGVHQRGYRKRYRVCTVVAYRSYRRYSMEYTMDNSRSIRSFGSRKRSPRFASHSS